MRDSVFKSSLGRMSIDELRRVGDEGNTIYNIVELSDTSKGMFTSVISTPNLDTALKIFKDEFEKEALSWIKESHMDESDIAELKDSDDYELDDTYGYLNLGYDHLTMYITANKLL